MTGFIGYGGVPSVEPGGFLRREVWSHEKLALVPSERFYAEISVAGTDRFGGALSLFWDEDSGLLVADIATFEKWVKKTLG